MSRIAYVNGRYLPQSEASVNVEDRGYQFADGVYEVLYLSGGRFLDEDLHMRRLERSLGEIGIAPPMGRAAMLRVIREVTVRNRLRDGLVYMQVTRGVARRDHAFPSRPVPPAMVVTCRRTPPYPTDVDRLGRRGDLGAGSALGALRHQVDRLAAQRAGQAGGQERRRLRGDPDRPRGNGDGRCVQHRMGGRRRRTLLRRASSAMPFCRAAPATRC